MPHARRHTKILICLKGCSAQVHGGKAMQYYGGQNTQTNARDLGMSIRLRGWL